MSSPNRVITLGDEPTQTEKAWMLFLGGFPLILLLIAYSISERSPVFLFIMFFGGVFPLLFLRAAGKEVHLNGLQIPVPRGSLNHLKFNF